MDSFDRLVLSIIAGLVVLIGGVVALGDHVGVPVVGYTPREGDTPPVTTSIQITFGEMVDTVGAEGHFSIEPAVEGRFRWEHNTLIFTPDPAFQPGQVYIVRLSSGVESATGRRSNRSLSWSFKPRQPRIVYLAPADAPSQGLWVIGQGGVRPEELFAPDQGILDYALNHDGTQIALTVYDNDQATDIWIFDLQNEDKRQVTACSPALCENPAWSIDGRLIAYERRELPAEGLPGLPRVWLYDRQTGENSALFTDGEVYGASPVFSPDGNRLAYFDVDARAIRVLALDGGEGVAVPSRFGETGVFSPTGDGMVYEDIRPVGSQYFPQLWRADFAGEVGLSPLFDEAQEDLAPAWSPDGQWIAFSRRRLDRQGGIAAQGILLHLETGELREITHNPAYNNTHFWWDPTGHLVLVQRFYLDGNLAHPELWIYDVDADRLSLLVENAVDGRWLP
jgi:Tol biopolymer transport system component